MRFLTSRNPLEFLGGFFAIFAGTVTVGLSLCLLSCVETREGHGDDIRAFHWPSRWVIDPAAHQPMVKFAFPPPLDDYHGTASEITGEIVCDGRGLSNGHFEVKTKSISLGGDEIDENARSAMFLDVKSFPTSRFTIARIEPTDERRPPFPPCTATLYGTFEMKGQTIDLQVPATFEQVKRDGLPDRLIMTASWSINILHPFNIPGPGAEGPSNETVHFTAKIALKPAP